MLESERIKSEKQKIHDKYDNTRKEKAAEIYTRITFAASFKNSDVLIVTYPNIVQVIL